MRDQFDVYRKMFNLPGATFVQTEYEKYGRVAKVYRVLQKSFATQYIVKICHRSQDYEHEVYFLKKFANIIPVPKIINVIEPQVNIDGAILMECLQQEPLTQSNFTDELAYELGVVLARIHAYAMQGYGDPLDEHSLIPDPRSYFTMKFEEGIAECSDHLPKILIEKCLSYYEKNLYLLDSVDGPCIVHRDFRQANVMMYQSALQGIIDWSSARASFAQEDFCTLLNDGWAISPLSKQSFFAGYASIRKVPNFNEIMPLLKLSRAVAVVGFTVKQGTWNHEDADLYQSNRKILETFLG